MQNMTAEELEGYAQAMGFTLKACSDKADKIALIQRRRERTVTVEALGLELSVSVKRYRSSKFGDLINKPGRTGTDLVEAFRGLLGDSQLDALMRACADEDGEVDEDALAYVFSTILRNEELKNY